MKIFIDGDGCPVIDITIKTATEYGIDLIIICDTSHEIRRRGVETITVSKGNDSVDFYLVNKVSQGDIVVTQDYGLAAMCMAKGARVLNQNGIIFTEKNIDLLLMSRYMSKKIRMSGGRLKGPPKRNAEDDTNFHLALIKLLKKE